MVLIAVAIALIPSSVGNVMIGTSPTMTTRVVCRELVLEEQDWEVKYHHPEVGFNSRLDSLQAIVLSAKLSRLADWNESRRRAADRYEHLLADCDAVKTPKAMAGNEHVWHIYAVRVDPQHRDRILAEIQSKGIGAGIHYPVPLHLQGAFSSLGHQKGDFPATESAAQEMISLPLFPGINEQQQEEVAETLRAALP